MCIDRQRYIYIYDVSVCVRVCVRVRACVCCACVCRPAIFYIGVLPDGWATGAPATVFLRKLAARYLEKKTRRIFFASPLPVSPGSPEVGPTIDKKQAPRI